MSRSLWKGPYIDTYIWKKIKKVTRIPTTTNNSTQKSNKIWSRRSMILPALIGNKYQVHTGNKWINLTIHQDLIGHYFGEFAFTKKIAQYKRKSKLKKKGK